MTVFYTARHRAPARRRTLHMGAGALGAAAVVTVLTGAPANADITRCVGAVDTPGAFACYTSPHLDHVGVDRSNTVDFPAVCYGLGCTQSQLEVWMPADSYGGRFTAVSYLGHSYTVFRPASGQPYVLTSTNPRLGQLVEAQVLVLEGLLTAAGQ